MLLELCEFIILSTVFLFFCSQVFYPLYRGTPLFPFFRPEHELRKKLSEEKQVSVEEEIKDAISKEKKR